jgi:cysteine desulfurase
MIYLDHAATTPLDRRVLEVMGPYFTEIFGNPSAVYAAGTRAAKALDEARQSVADVLGADRREIVFTSGASESINLALRGVAWSARAAGRGHHLISAATEHHATLHTLQALAASGFEVTILPVDERGAITASQVEAALRSETVLVSLMAANNEIGTLHPIAAVGALCRRRTIALHVDAVQAAGALDLSVDRLGASLLSLSGHKLYGPKGTGVLYVREGTSLHPQVTGGAQESGRRAGTENVPGIVGFAKALELAATEREQRSAHAAKLRDRLIEGLLSIPDSRLNGHPSERLPNNVHLSFAGIEGQRTRESLLALLDREGICASAGSACNTRSLEPSHVLKAIGLDASLAFGSLRLTVGHENTEAEIDRVLEVVPRLVERLRKLKGTDRPT